MAYFLASDSRDPILSSLRSFTTRNIIFMRRDDCFAGIFASQFEIVFSMNHYEIVYLVRKYVRSAMRLVSWTPSLEIQYGRTVRFEKFYNQNRNSFY